MEKIKTKEETLNDAIKNASGGWSMEFDKCLEAMQIFADQETSSLREQLKEKEEEMMFTALELNQKVSLLRSCETALEERGKEVEHWKIEFNQQSDLNASLVIENTQQSKLIESLAGALRDFVEDDNYGRNLINSVSREMDMYEAPKRKILIKGEEALTEYNNYKNKQNGTDEIS